MLKIAAILLLGACSCAHSPSARAPRNQEEMPDLSFLFGMEEATVYKVAEKADAKGAVSIAVEGVIKADAADAMAKALAKASKVKGAKSILLKINSEGGNFDAAMEMSRVIEASETPVDCLVDGEAASSAFYILQSCRDRAATERSALMAHEPYAMSFQHADRARTEELLEEIEIWSNQFASHCAARMGITTKEMQAKIKRRDWWLKPQEALEARALDRVAANPNTPAPAMPAAEKHERKSGRRSR